MLDFEMVFQNNNQFIFRFLMKLCGDASLAEELTQETFFRAYMNMSALRNEEKVAVWLCQIAKNTYFAWFNEQKRKQPISQLTPTDNTPDIAELFEEKELAGRAFSVLHALEEPYKEVFWLRTFGELSFAQIGALFDKTESWARVTYYRAKIMIKEELQ